MPKPKIVKNLPVKVDYHSFPVEIPDSFLAPFEDPSVIKVDVLDFQKSVLPEYAGRYAVVLDGVLTPSECSELLVLAEKSAGAHQDPPRPGIENDGWKPAMVNVGGGFEVVMPDYRNSDRIIWDSGIVMNRLWKRVLQAEEVKKRLESLHGEADAGILGFQKREDKRNSWVPTSQGINERMRFLKYGAGQFFRRHCDGSYVSPDGLQESYFTVHLYLNDSAQALGIPEPEKDSTDPRLVDTPDRPAELLRGGATTFHSNRNDSRIDVDPKAGRVLIFQHRALSHSGDDVKAGIKYTLRSDIMYQVDAGTKA